MTIEPTKGYFTIESWHFHWKFWMRKECNGGPVYFGWWAEISDDSGAMSPDQVAVKQSMGIIR